MNHVYVRQFDVVSQVPDNIFISFQLLIVVDVLLMGLVLLIYLGVHWLFPLLSAFTCEPIGGFLSFLFQTLFFAILEIQLCYFLRTCFIVMYDIVHCYI